MIFSVWIFGSLYDAQCMFSRDNYSQQHVRERSLNCSRNITFNIYHMCNEVRMIDCSRSLAITLHETLEIEIAQCVQVEVSLCFEKIFQVSTGILQRKGRKREPTGEASGPSALACCAWASMRDWYSCIVEV